MSEMSRAGAGAVSPGPPTSSSARGEGAPGGADPAPALDASEARFWAKVEKTDGCWLWHGARHPKGYGRFSVGGRQVYAHRFAYVLLIGPIPAGLQIDHLCRIRHCVNPAHMEPVTNRENVLRGVSSAAKRARRTHCPQGHSDYMAYKGGRTCRICREYDSNVARVARRRRARQRAAEQSASDPHPSRWRPAFVDNDARGVPTTRETVKVKGGVL